MPDSVEFDPVDSIAAGAIGEPGHRAFYIQAQKDGARLTVLVEKEQVAILAERTFDLLGQVAADHPEDPVDVEASLSLPADVSEPAVPLFRATAMGIGFDPQRELMVLELYERPPADAVAETQTMEEAAAGEDEEEGHVARLFATRTQMRAMAARAAEAVEAGRPPCPYCRLPLDPDGHVCPAMNGHRE